jgi:TatD DNase family protein
MNLVDTHCHIHEATFELEGDNATRAKWLQANAPDPDLMISEAVEAGVTRLICVGTTVPDSRVAVDFVRNRDGVWASIGIHPHEAGRYVHDHHALQQFHDLARKPKVVAIGETGLDYHYSHSTPEQQKQLLRFQLDMAVEHDLPLIFHVRGAFEDFWPIFDAYQGLRGVVHSFAATEKELEQILERGLYVGLNGIMTFTKDQKQLAAAKKAPIERILTETDAPFLTPVPFRGRICEPRHVRVTADFLSKLRGESLDQFAAVTTQNALDLFKI